MTTFFPIFMDLLPDSQHTNECWRGWMQRKYLVMEKNLLVIDREYTGFIKRFLIQFNFAFVWSKELKKIIKVTSMGNLAGTSKSIKHSSLSINQPICSSLTSGKESTGVSKCCQKTTRTEQFNFFECQFAKFHRNPTNKYRKRSKLIQNTIQYCQYYYCESLCIL